jgi:hypothetical protein
MLNWEQIRKTFEPKIEARPHTAVRNFAVLSCKYLVLFQLYKYNSEREMSYEFMYGRMFAVSFDPAGGVSLLLQNKGVHYFNT